jgi:hypothetical protein
MTSPKDDADRSATGKDGSTGKDASAGMAAQLDALQDRLAGVRRQVAEISHAGAEAWRAVEPDARRLIAELRGVLDNAGDRFREARTGAAAAPDARAATGTPPAIPPATPDAAGEPKPGSGPRT